jgi:putative intracellular protease/amidase
MKVLMVITSHDQLGNTGRKTGFWLEELAAPYYVFKDAGAEIILASPKGGRPPLDPKSNEPEFRTDLTVRFEKDAAAEAQLDKTVRLDSVKQQDFDNRLLSGWPRPDVGSRRRQALREVDRVLPCRG